MANLPKISIIIPTRNSEKILPICLNGIVNQNYPKAKFEIIIVDNESSDKTVGLAKSFGAKTFLVKGSPSRACAQRNLGAEKAKGDYLLFLDHDMEMSKNLLKNFAEKLSKTKDTPDVWYIPEKIIANSPFFTKIRNFERSFYNATIIDAVRIIKKEKFNLISERYDSILSSGPADWAMDIQLEKIGCKFDIIDEPLYHHEERFTYWQYITKKGDWTKGIDLYKAKWKKKDPNVYNKVIKKQFGIYYRLIGVFTENGKWRKLIPNFHLYIFVLLTKILMGFEYLVRRFSGIDEKLIEHKWN